MQGGVTQIPTMSDISNRAEKKIRDLCAYFEEHVETWQDPKSLNILTEVFD